MDSPDRERAGPVRPLFTVAEAARLTGGTVLPTRDAPAPAGGLGPPSAGGLSAGADPEHVVLTGVEVDSRLVREGDLFCALPGERVDGHDFVGRAFDAGARAALVTREPEDPAPQGGGRGGFLIRVPGAVSALGRLARAHRDRFDLPLVGVTGSVGKTTTKDLIASALSGGLTVLANRGNLNTDIGLPLTIFELGPEHQAACLEMGMRGPGEIERLCSIARPSVGVVTNVGPVHIELLGSVEAISRAKEELLYALPDSGSAVLNADDAIVAGMGARHRGRLERVLTYGFSDEADVRAGAPVVLPSGDTAFEVALSPGAAELARAAGLAVRAGETAPPASGAAGLSGLGRFTIPLAGRHSVSNALAALAVGLLLGVAPEALREGLARASLSAMRQETTDAGGVRVINDAYNAGPGSMAAAIDLLADLRTRRGGRAVAVLGDMLELGPVSEEAHREVGRLAAGAGIDFLVAVGPRSEALAEEATESGLGRDRVVHHAEPDPGAVASSVLSVIRPGDTVLVKASRGMKLEQVVGRLLACLRERDVRSEREWSR